MKKRPVILLFKSHVDAYTRKDGVTVRAHEVTRRQYLAHHGFEPENKTKWFSAEKTQKEREHWKHIGDAIDRGDHLPPDVVQDYKSVGVAPGWLSKKINAAYPAGAKEEKNKSGWEMSSDEFAREFGSSVAGGHRAVVERAVAAGKPVPKHVREAYKLS